MDDFPCVVCDQNVRRRQEAMECDTCQRWQHRVKCTPNITRVEYRQLPPGEVHWNCRDCSHNTEESLVAESLVEESPENTEIDATVYFHVDDEFDDPNDTMEDSIEDPAPQDVDLTPMPVTFHHIEEGSQKGKCRLVESTGYSYAVKERKGDTTYWTCSDATRRFLRKLLSLPYLPAQHIQCMFSELSRQANTPALKEVTDYIQETWMDSSVWNVDSWSVFGRSIRTNNDVEGWHRRLNHSATRPKVQFYLLVPLLHKEAELVRLQMRLVSDGKLKRTQRRSTRETQGKIFELWRLYKEGQFSTSSLLRQVSAVHIF